MRPTISNSSCPCQPITGAQTEPYVRDCSAQQLNASVRAWCCLSCMCWILAELPFAVPVRGDVVKPCLSLAARVVRRGIGWLKQAMTS